MSTASLNEMQVCSYNVNISLHSFDNQLCLQKQQNEYYLNMMKQLLDTPHLYFSYTYDLTHSLQRLNSMSPEFLQMGLLERADMRFVWNGFLLKPFQKPYFRQYCLPLILGCEYRSQYLTNADR
jgi:SacI homology domain